ncbi:uncharacterized protein [Dysidea avara]|uniref:uncharacterized protein n=1 Tax=Dysidea avara TaxID=196820 RepID=UPI0033228715
MNAIQPWYTTSLLILFTLPYLYASDIHIVVDWKTGKYNSSCLSEADKYPCASLDFAFSNLSDCHGHSVSITIHSGNNYTFNLNSTVTGALFQNCVAVSIIGSGEDNTVVNCGENAGLFFQGIQSVTITGISFNECGSIRNSTSVDVSSSTTKNTTILLSAALYFIYCKDVTISNVTVMNSNSTGVVMYNTYGNLVVEGSLFESNRNQSIKSLLSNGGFYAEFVFCDPGIVKDNCTQKKNFNANYLFRSNNFSNNHATDRSESTLFYLPVGANYYSFGRGGGLSIVFKGNTHNNSVIIDDCDFHDNSASWGGGVLVEFEDTSKFNKVIIKNTNFTNNSVIIDTEHRKRIGDYGTSGGGVRVGFVLLTRNYSESVQYNSMLFDNCVFDNNSAYWGGGFGLYMPSEENVINATNSLHFNACTWKNNQAYLGSAVDLDYWRTEMSGPKMPVYFTSCSFVDNRNDKYFKHGILKNFNSPGTGALYTNGLPVIFEEYVEFIGNENSALAVFDTTAIFFEHCLSNFSYNSAWTGGAIALLGAAQMRIHPNTTFLFHNNKAKLKGGAIFALQPSRHNLLSGGNCFLQYSDQFVSSPNNWITNFTFESNCAPIGSSIFTTTLLPCAWGASFGNLTLSLSKVLNWHQFNYTPNDVHQIATDVSVIHVMNNEVKAIPGKYTILPINTTDDRGNRIERSLWLMSQGDNVNLTWSLTASSTINVYGNRSQNTTIQLTTDSIRVVSAELSVKLDECPPGYYFNSSNSSCQCSFLAHGRELDGILCDNNDYVASIKRGYWAGYYLSKNHSHTYDDNLITGQCPQHYCSNSTQKEIIFLPNACNISALNEILCHPFNRNGTLCGRCIEGYAVAINSPYYDCIDCSNIHGLSKHGWVTLILTEYIPSTILFCVLLFFDINLHAGTISSIVLYFQIFDSLNIYSDDDVDQPNNSDGLLTGIGFVYNIWNLDFFGRLLHPYCINNKFNTMDILLFKYISGFYPFILFLIFAVLTNLVYINFCGWERITICLRQIRNYCTRFKIIVTRKGSTVSGLATCWTLVITKLALISGLILSREVLRGSSVSNLTVKVAWLDGSMPLYKGDHIPYVVVAILVLVLFVLIPVVGLLSYPLVPQIMGIIQERSFVDLRQYRIYQFISGQLERPFLHLKPLIDCFQGSCRARCEFYAGLLYCYRLSIIFVYSFTIRETIFFYSAAISLVFVIITALVHPYKKPRDNIVTILCVSNIVFINLISIYHLYHSETLQNDRDIQVLLWLQLILVLLPFVFFVLYMIWKSWKKLKAYWKQEPLYSRVPVSDELDVFPARMLENSLQFDPSRNDNVGAASPLIGSAAASPLIGSAAGSGHKSTTQSSSGQGQNSNSGSGGQTILGNTSDPQ